MKLIAELGTLHLESEKNLCCATEEALRAGADLVKVQVINPATAWWATKTQLKRYQRLNLRFNEWRRYFRWAKKNFKDKVFASIWDLDLLWALDELMPRWKLGYKAHQCPRLIEATVDTGKEVLISCKNEAEVKLVRDSTLEDFKGNLKPLHVISKYPTPIERWFVPVHGLCYHGFSVHYERHEKRLEALKILIALPLEYLEVHVQGRHAEGPDCEFALTMDELRELKNFTSPQVNFEYNTTPTTFTCYYNV